MNTLNSLQLPTIQQNFHSSSPSLTGREYHQYPRPTMQKSQSQLQSHSQSQHHLPPSSSSGSGSASTTNNNNNNSAGPPAPGPPPPAGSVGTVGLGTNIHIRSPNSNSPFSTTATATSFHPSYSQPSLQQQQSTQQQQQQQGYHQHQGSRSGNSATVSSPSLQHQNSFHYLSSSSTSTLQQQPQINTTTPTPSHSSVPSPVLTASPKLKSKPHTHRPTFSNNSPIMTAAPNFVSNKPASQAGSLYQKCALLKERLETVSGLEPYIEACFTNNNNNNNNNDSRYSASSSISNDFGSTTSLVGAGSSNSSSTNGSSQQQSKLDPVSFVWRFLRLGASLCALFNVLEPNALLKCTIPEDVKQSKRAVYDFVQGCKAELGYSDNELFTISNVFSDNTSDLLKVIHTVELLLDTLESRGMIPPTVSPGVKDIEPKDKRDKVVQELLLTERKFVQDMEVLYNYQVELQNSGILSVDTIHALFPNLSTLVDFQRRFLVGIEYNATLPPQEQRFGSLFETMEEGIEVYKGYSLNQQNACDIASQEVHKLQAFSHLIEPTYELPCILIKPIQRICKYPLLLKELIKYTPEDWQYYQELLDGLEAIKRITNDVNESQRQVENGLVLKELQERLRDWRGHNINDFGELLHEGVFPVVKTGMEREYHLYLFENIILCCKEANQNKKGMAALGSKKKQVPQLQQPSTNNKRSSLVLKGRIYMAYVTNVAISKRDGYFLHISWGKDDASDTGFFDIRFRHEELLNQWESTIRKMVARYQESANELLKQQVDRDPALVNGTSYDDGSDDEYVSDYSASREQLANNVDPFDPSQFSPVSEGNRGVSGGSYPFPYQQNIGVMTEDLHAFKITEGSREGSQVSLASTATNSRSRSASTPSFSNPMANQYHQNIGGSVGRFLQQPPPPPVPSLPQGQQQAHYQPPKASRIKSEGAVGTAERYGYSSQDSTSSTASSAGRSVSTSTTSNSSYSAAQKVKIKLHFLDDSFLIMVPEAINYMQLLERIERKIRLCGKQTPSPLRIKYKDEDEDFVSINSDEDIQMALEQHVENNSNVVTIWVA